jgi:hypothetical protein
MNRTDIPYEARCDFWKFMTAGLTFEQAAGAWKDLLENGRTEADPLFYPLQTAAIVFHGRPFKQKKPVRLFEAMVPSALHETHTFLISLRDKLFAHTDIDGAIEGETFLNKVGFRAELDGELTAFCSSLRLKEKQIRKALELDNVLATKCMYHADRVYKQCAKRLKLRPGAEYEVNLHPGTGPFLVPFKPLGA